MYFDSDFNAGRRSTYKYLTTVYPLWAGLASAPQAAAVRRRLPDFEQPGGLATSTTVSGTQWDAPYGRAPLQWFTIAGLQRGGFTSDAKQLARAFTQTAEQNYQVDGTIRGKYDVVSGSSNIVVAAGYRANVIGFGWTNGV